MIISLDTKKAFHNIQQSFMIKVFEISGTQRAYINIIKAIHYKLRANMKFDGEKFKVISLKSGT